MNENEDIVRIVIRAVFRLGKTIPKYINSSKIFLIEPGDPLYENLTKYILLYNFFLNETRLVINRKNRLQI